MPNPNGNRLRCRGCKSLAGKDGWCKNHRPKPNTELNKEHYPLQRDSYKGYDGYIGKKSFFQGEYGVVKDEFDINKEDYH